jgi:hypothetical protein
MADEIMIETYLMLGCKNETDFLVAKLQDVQKLQELFLLIIILNISCFIRTTKSIITVRTRMQTEVYLVKMISATQHYRKNTS